MKKRTPRPTAQARALLENFCTCSFKWTVSRGQYTYGYNICTMYLHRRNGDKVKVSSCNGGGYDMKGTALGNWAEKWFSDDLKKLTSSTGSLTKWNTRGTFYGLNFYDPKRKQYRKSWRPGYSLYLDGACGFNEMCAILHALGLNLYPLTRTSREDFYIFRLTTDKEPKRLELKPC